MCRGGAMNFSGPEAILLFPFLSAVFLYNYTAETVEKSVKETEKKNAIFSEKFSTSVSEYLKSINQNFDNFQVSLTFTNEQKENLLLKRCLSYFQLKKFEFAKRDAQDCLKLNSTNYLAHYLLCLINIRQGNYLDSLNHAKEALENYDKVIPLESSFEFENMKNSLNTTEDKEFNWNTTVKTVGGFFSNFGIGEKKKEIPRVMKIEKLEFLYGSCLLQNEYYFDGISYFEDLCSKSPKMIEFYYYLIGTSYYHLYDKKNAIKYFNLAKEYNYSSEKCDLMIFMSQKSSMKDFEIVQEIGILKKKYSGIKIPECHIKLLSDDVIMNILSYLNYGSIIQLGQTGTIFNHFMKKPEVWNDRIIQLREFNRGNYDKMKDRKVIIQILKHPVCQHSTIIVQNDIPNWKLSNFGLVELDKKQHEKYYGHISVMNIAFEKLKLFSQFYCGGVDLLVLTTSTRKDTVEKKMKEVIIGEETIHVHDVNILLKELSDPDILKNFY
eukprot:gene11241-4061_t